MAVLAMDTATQVLAVAIGREGTLTASAASQIPRAHSRLLQPMLADIMGYAGVNAGELERIVVGVGPGSYTGVRLGVATAKAMAAALGIPLTPVSTLHVLADAACPGEAVKGAWVLPLLYARRGRAFGALLHKAGHTWTVRVAERVAPVSYWLETLSSHAVNGQGDTVILHDFAAELSQEVDFQGHASMVLTLTAVAGGLGAALLRCGERAASVYGDAVHGVVPHYVQPVEAEVKLGEKAINRGNS